MTFLSIAIPQLWLTTNKFLSMREKSKRSKNEVDSRLPLGSVGTIQLLLWSLDIYSPEGWPEGHFLNTSQTQHSAPPAIKSIE